MRDSARVQSWLDRYELAWRTPGTDSLNAIFTDGDVAVVRVEVRYEDAAPREYRDLWIIRFGPDGRCREFEEWPFWPGQPRIAPGTH
jgi:hypothetical protein